eukprot:CAMPEP_0197450080 /NCGR_PEP_ID=MMETSP1175-20131217/23958_1 /TAXON_ID=1003142 /ORGANISM="Triceratium dubium, Strain CCMP147" /LENGTH=61 /DNA_ID=CAMNT_0042982419 /DNA_START=209 /DNA_END=390 /DNA_ORIENTATION=+
MRSLPSRSKTGPLLSFYLYLAATAKDAASTTSSSVNNDDAPGPKSAALDHKHVTPTYMPFT